MPQREHTLLLSAFAIVMGCSGVPETTPPPEASRSLLDEKIRLQTGLVASLESLASAGRANDLEMLRAKVDLLDTRLDLARVTRSGQATIDALGAERIAAHETYAARVQSLNAVGLATNEDLHRARILVLSAKIDALLGRTVR